MKLLLKVIGLVLALLICYALVCFGLILSKRNERPTDLAGIQTILVLGGRILPDGQPGSMTKDRLHAAIDIARKIPEAQIIVSGAKGADEPATEASVMADYLRQHQIKNTIVKEERATNTRENFSFSKKYVKGRVLLVTSDFHMYRSMLMAKREAYQDITAYAAKTTKARIFLGKVYTHEIIAVAYYLIF